MSTENTTNIVLGTNTNHIRYTPAEDLKDLKLTVLFSLCR